MFLSTIVFLNIACTEKEPVDTGNATPQEDFLYYTSQWSGSFTIDNNELVGQEQHLSTQFSEEAELECGYVWDLVGTIPEDPVCDGCKWEFNIVATLNEEESVFNIDDCELSSSNFVYGYNEVYNYNEDVQGQALLYRAPEEIGFGIFVFPNNPDAQEVDTYSSEIEWDESTGEFSYIAGYLHYEHAL